MNSEPVCWSEERQQQLQEYLTGMWAEDIWEFSWKEGRRLLSFPITSPSLKTEVKYALWSRFESGKRMLGADQRPLCQYVGVLIEWLNAVAPDTRSFLDKSLEHWELSLRSYLIETHRLTQQKRRHLLATQEYAEHINEDRRIGLLRQLYTAIANAYDDRPEMERDRWDMRKLGLSINPTVTAYYLNFTPISQPWLRRLAKAFMRYRIAVYSPADCLTKMNAIRAFSGFLARYVPACQPADINRALIETYMGAVREGGKSVIWRNQLLSNLRVFLETCAHRLQIPGFTKERLIFDDDFAKEPEYLSREIPEEVLIQLREHLHTLPTTYLRMVVILLECGMRINELCTLPLNCLTHDDRNEWYLHFFQRKSSKEHVIPLVNDDVIGTIQAQQQEARTQWGERCAYLFPHPRFPQRPYLQSALADALNKWAVEKEIRDQSSKLWHFQTHQFRHTVSMRLINDDVPIEVISRLLGHSSVKMTERYARKRKEEVRRELARVQRKRKTVNYQGHVVKGDPLANDPEAQILRRGIRGQTLPVGGCGRLVVLGGCPHANSCLTCTFWLTSTEDLPALKSFYERAVRLRKLANERGNGVVLQQQDRLIPLLALRIKGLEETEKDGAIGVENLLLQLREDLAEAEGALEEVRQLGLIQAAKFLEQAIADLKEKMTALEGEG